MISYVICVQMLHKTGNEDICYFNFACARPFGVFTAFNNVFSNIGYVVLGFCYIIIVCLHKMKYSKLSSEEVSPNVISGVNNLSI